MSAPFTPETAILLALLIPALGAVGIRFTGPWPNVREAVTLVASVALFLVVLSILPVVMDGGRPAVTLIELLPGVPLAFEVEPLGMLFALVASLLWPINSLYSIGYMRGNHEHSQTRFYICFAIALASTMGIAFAGNLLTLFVFYEVLTLSTYPLVAHHEDDAARHGGRVYLGILLSTSIGLLLPGLLWIYSVTGTLDFEAAGIVAGHFDGWLAGLLVFLFMFGIGKAALMPIQRWLPAAMVAPTPVSALLHAVAVVKAGVFTFTEFGPRTTRTSPLGSVASTQYSTEEGPAAPMASSASNEIVSPRLTTTGGLSGVRRTLTSGSAKPLVLSPLVPEEPWLALAPRPRRANACHIVPVWEPL